jgi:hypothetical protein
MTNIIGANGGVTHLAADWADNLPLFPNCRTGASTSRNTTTYFETKNSITCINCAAVVAYRAAKADPHAACEQLPCDGCDAQADESERRDLDAPVLCESCASVPDDRAEYAAYAHH